MKLMANRQLANHVIYPKVLSRRLHGVSPLTPLLYAESCYFTKALQFTIEGIHALEIPWAGTFMLSGVLFRCASFPLSVYAERLSAERYRVVNTLNYELMKKFSIHYNLNIVASKDGQFFQLDTTDKSILQKTDKLPDPYYILPVSIGILGFLNYYAQQRIYAAYSLTKLMPAINVCYALFMMAGIYYMSFMPVCIPLFWLSVSITGTIQHFAFRHPKVKNLLGIKPLPSDSTTPVRDLFLK